MRNLLLVLTMILVSAPVVFAAGCTSSEVFTAKMKSYMSRFEEAESTESMDKFMAVKKEKNAYVNKTFLACSNYFLTVNRPSCSKLNSLAISYKNLEPSKRAKAKVKMDKITEKCKVTCRRAIKLYQSNNLLD